MPNQFSSQQTNNTAAPRERLHWVDFAKAAAIALVVLYHVGGAGMDYLFPNPGGPSARFWPLLNDVLLPVRMPLFFVTAGLLAHHTLGRPWPQLLRTRVLVLLWPYFIWSIFFATVAGFAYRPSDPKSYMADHLLGALYAASAYWFLLALVIFFAAARLLRRAPMPLLLVTFAVVLAAPALQPLVQETLPPLAATGVNRLTHFAFWYFLGCFGHAAVTRVARMNPWLLSLLGAAAFLLLTATKRYADQAPNVNFLLSLAGVVCAIGVSVIAVRSSKIRSLATYIAGRTLPIYLLHPVVINLTVLIFVVFQVERGPNQLWATLLTLPLSIVSILLSVVTYDRLIKTPLAWIYRPPARVSAAIA